MGTFGEGLVEGLQQALRFAKGDPTGARVHHVEVERRNGVRYVWRSRHRFVSAGRAWEDIAADTGLTSEEVQPAHTATRWRWRLSPNP